MQVRVVYPAKIRIIRGGKKKTHSSAFDKFETFVFLKKHRDAHAPCYLDFYWPPQKNDTNPANLSIYPYEED